MTPAPTCRPFQSNGRDRASVCLFVTAFILSTARVWPLVWCLWRKGDLSGNQKSLHAVLLASGRRALSKS